MRFAHGVETNKMKLNVTGVFKRNWDAIHGKNEDGSRRYKYIINKGSSRSSKTYSLIDCFDLYARNNSNKRLTAWRETKKDCKDTLWNDFIKRLRETERYNDRAYNKTETIYQYKSGSRIEARGTDDESVFGLTQDCAWLNEPYSISKTIFDQIDQRTSDFIFIDWNPKQDHWIDDLEKHERALVIQSTFLDNPFCPNESRIKLLSYEPLPDELKYLKNEPIENVPSEYHNAWHNEKNHTAHRFNWEVYGLGIKGEVEGKVFSNYEIIDELPNDAEFYGFGMDYGYSCFSGETLITTKSGEIPISEITNEDYVLTRYGYNKVISLNKNGYNYVINKEFDYGNIKKRIFATSNHKFNVNNEWEKLSTIKKTDNMYVLSNLTGINSKDTQVGNIQTIITENGKKTGNIYNKYCIGKYIKNIMDLLRMGMLYIISILTHLIIVLKTYKQLHQANIIKYTEPWMILTKKTAKNILKKLGSIKIIGILGEKLQWINFNLNKRNAVAEQNILQQMYIKDFAVENATISGNINPLYTMLKWIAKIATINFKETNILNQNAAQNNVQINYQQLTGLKTKGIKYCKVYDLTIENNNEYFANGILVHNCDPTTIIGLYEFNGLPIAHEVICSSGLKLTPLADLMKEKGIKPTDLIIIDKSAPLIRDEIYDRGFTNIHSASRGVDTIVYGIDKMKDYKIQITRQSTNLIREFENYKNAKNKQGKYLNEPEKNQSDHCIDGLRYVFVDKYTQPEIFFM